MSATLTRREREVLEQAARGLSRYEAASESHHSSETVLTMRRLAMRRLGARNIANAVYIAARAGMI